MPKVNNIPTVEEFRSDSGWGGFYAKKFKKMDDSLCQVLRALGRAQSYRASNGWIAVGSMRELRKSCIKYLTVHRGKRRSAMPSVQKLALAADDRVNRLITRHYRPRVVDTRARAAKKQRAAAHDAQATSNGQVGKALHADYEIERFSPNHVPGASVGFVKRKFRDFKARYPGNQLTIEAWIEMILIPENEEDPSRVFFDQSRFSYETSVLKAGVRYCDAQERQHHLLLIQNGQVTDANGDPFHTAGWVSKAGTCWAIFVADFQRNIYAGQHQVSKFHHSSFLAGNPVLSAGEIAVDRGQIKGVTNKTGHYKAGAAELKRALEILQERGVDLQQVSVNDPLKGSGYWRYGNDALADQCDFTSESLRAKPDAPMPSID